jgi:hypothetical protein
MRINVILFICSVILSIETNSEDLIPVPVFRRHCFSSTLAPGICRPTNLQCYQTTRGRGVMTNDAAENCLIVACSFMTYAKFKGDQCCVDLGNVEWLSQCLLYVGQPCGLFGGVSQVWSKCCREADGSFALLICDEGGVSLMVETCKTSYTCVERNSVLGDIGPYAQCERTEL